MSAVTRALHRVDDVQQRHRWSAFVVGVIKKAGDDQASSLAALLTYYAFLSIFPLLLVFVTVLGFVLDGNPQLRRDLVNSALADFPVIGNELRRNIHALGGNGLGLAVGLLGLLWGSLGVAQAAQHIMAEVWNVPIRARPGFTTRLARAVLLLGTLALAVVATTSISGVLANVSVGVVAQIGGVVVALLLSVALYLAAFRILTPKGVASTRDLVPGAVAGGIAWTVLQFLGSYLVTRQLRHTSELYGFFAIVLGLTAWLYLASQVMVYAAEINVVRARRLWPRSLVQPPLTPADEASLTAAATAEERRPEEHVGVRFDSGETRSA